MTLKDLLLNSFFRGNQTLLSETLKINRGTLRKYLEDTEGNHHLIKINFDNENDNTYELFTNNTNKLEIKK